MNDRIEKRIELRASVSRVWRALTDYREFGEWFRVKLDGPFVPVQIARGHITYPGYEHLKWEAVVQTMEVERLFSFTWHPYAVDPKTDYSKETPTLVEFRLEKTTSGTLLLLKQAGRFWVNEKFAGKYENGITPCGLDLTGLVNFGGADNLIAVKVDNSNNYKEEGGSEFEWMGRAFNPNYGGLNHDIRLILTGKVYQTLPLYENLRTRSEEHTSELQ